jgi:hypothetical protein
MSRPRHAFPFLGRPSPCLTITPHHPLSGQSQVKGDDARDGGLGGLFGAFQRGGAREHVVAHGKINRMAIPNVKRFRPFCPSCNDTFTVMAVLPKDANVDAYLNDVVARHDHKAFQESKLQHFKIRVGQQKQKKAK